MKYPAIKQLDTPRLILRKLTHEDLPLYYERLGSSADVTQYMLFQPHRDISESAASIEKTLRRYEEGKGYRWAITAKRDGSIIGIIDLLSFDEARECCSFAYMLGKDFWGKGYGTEALTAVLDFGFRELEVWSIHADHFADNAASGAAMRKVGMRYVGTVREKYEKNGRKFDAPQYIMTREMWEAKN